MIRMNPFLPHNSQLHNLNSRQQQTLIFSFLGPVRLWVLSWAGLGLGSGWVGLSLITCMCLLIFLRPAPHGRSQECKRVGRKTWCLLRASLETSVVELPLTLHWPEQAMWPSRCGWGRERHLACPRALYVTQQVRVESYGYHTGVFPSRLFYAYCTWLNNYIKIILYLLHSSPFPCIRLSFLFQVHLLHSHLSSSSFPSASSFPCPEASPPGTPIFYSPPGSPSDWKNKWKNQGTDLLLI